MKFHFNITGKLTLVFVLFGAALLGSLGVLAYTSGRTGLQDAATSELLTEAIEKQTALEGWITTARINIAAQAKSLVVAEQAAALLAAAPGSPEALGAHDRLVNEFQPYVVAESNFTELLFIEVETGQVLAATNPSEEGKFKENMSFFINGKNAPYVSEMYFSVTLNRPAMTAAAPVISEDGRLLGVLAGRLDLDVLNALINLRTGLRQTDDAFLTNSIGLLVTQPRFISDPAVLQKTFHTEAVNRCLSRNSGVISADDYRGVPSLISYHWLPESQMCLIVKIDQAEAFAPSLAFTRTIMLTVGLALVMAIALAILLARTFTHPIRDLQTGAKRLSQGDLKYRVAVKSQDEIGLLAAAFNEMATSLEKLVAERKKAEEKFRAVSLYTRNLIETSLDPLVTISPAGKITDVNNATEEVTGVSREKLIGSDFSDYFSEPDKAQKGYKQVFTKGTVRDYPLTIRHSSGRTTEVLYNASVYKNEVGEIQGIFAAARDITERKVAERVRDSLYTISQAAVTTESLQELYLSIHRALDNLLPAENFYIAVYDPDADLISFPYFVDQYDEPSLPKKPGRGLTEYVLRTGRPLMADPKVFAQLVQQGEVELVGSNSVDWLGVPLKVGTIVFGVMAVQSYAEDVRFGKAEKEILEFVSTQVAITIERKQAEEKIIQLNASLEKKVEERTHELRAAQERLLRQERLATLGQLAGSIAHELRNPLGVISNAATYLAMIQPEADDKVREYIDIIKSETRTSEKIIADLLDFTRLQTVERKPAAISEIIQNVIKRNPGHASVKMKVDIPADLPLCLVNALQIEQVLGNLITNAYQAMSSGGGLLVSAEVCNEPAADGERVRIMVKDTGGGISTENLHKIFEPLFTTKAKGIGLGLAVSRKLVEANHGRIEVESEPGKGSTFTLYLPTKKERK